jgi:hypothetical protein
MKCHATGYTAVEELFVEAELAGKHGEELGFGDVDVLGEGCVYVFIYEYHGHDLFVAGFIDDLSDLFFEGFDLVA